MKSMGASGRQWALGAAAVFLLDLGGCSVPGGSVRAPFEVPPPVVAKAAPVAHQPRIDFARLPLQFVENRGQTNEQVRYYEQGRGHATWFADDGVYLGVQSPSETARPEGAPDRGQRPGADLFSKSPEPLRGEATRMRFIDAAPHPEIVAEEPLPGRINYLIGNDPEKWHTGLHTYGAVVYRQLYPGIDVRFYGNGRELEYDVVVAPGADPSQVRFAFDGARDVQQTDGAET